MGAVSVRHNKMCIVILQVSSLSQFMLFLFAGVQQTHVNVFASTNEGYISLRPFRWMRCLANTRLPTLLTTILRVARHQHVTYFVLVVRICKSPATTAYAPFD